MLMIYKQVQSLLKDRNWDNYFEHEYDSNVFERLEKYEDTHKSTKVTQR